jgi:glycosyltransferase involved in cell wall biosynthesis
VSGNIEHQPPQLNPELSIVMIFRDGMEFMREAVASIMCQTYQQWELLLVDDGSSDGSSQYARELAVADPVRIRYLHHAGHRNLGTAASRNIGLRETRGEFMIRLDCDDVFMGPDVLAEQVQLLRAHPDVAMVCGPCQYWSSWQGGADRLQQLGHANETIGPPNLLAAMFRPGDAEPISMMLRTLAVRDCGGFEATIRDFGEDFVLSLKLLLKFPVHVSDRCWYRYRVHPRSYSQSVIALGQRDARESELLDWVRGYLEGQAVLDPEIWAAFRERYRALRMRKWVRARESLTGWLRWLAWKAHIVVRRALRKFRGGSSGSLVVHASEAGIAGPNAEFRAIVRWCFSGTTKVQVRVGTPRGLLFVSSGVTDGEALTLDWVQDGMLFFLQDASFTDPGSRSATLDVVRVRRPGAN